MSFVLKQKGQSLGMFQGCIWEEVHVKAWRMEDRCGIFRTLSFGGLQGKALTMVATEDKPLRDLKQNLLQER